MRAGDGNMEAKADQRADGS